MIGQASVLFLQHRVEGDGQIGLTFLIIGAVLFVLSWFYEKKESYVDV